MHPAVMGGVGGQMVSHSSGVPYRIGSWRKGGGEEMVSLGGKRGCKKVGESEKMRKKIALNE